jgi:isoleucyl-tRNA synthetase
MYQNLIAGQKDKADSVSLCSWPVAIKDFIDKNLNIEMRYVRDIVSIGLEIRAKNGIKVRQPLELADLVVPNELDTELLDLIKEELNVKTVKYTKDKKIVIPQVSINLTISKELKEEGIAREAVRKIQDMRKKADFDVADRITLFFKTDSKDLESIINKTWSDYLKKETLSTDVHVEKTPDVEYNEDVLIEGQNIWIGLKRTKA